MQTFLWVNVSFISFTIIAHFLSTLSVTGDTQVVCLLLTVFKKEADCNTFILPLHYREIIYILLHYIYLTANNHSIIPVCLVCGLLQKNSL